MRASRFRDTAAAFVGMTFFWVFFRYQSFFEVLYPPALRVSLGGASVPAHVCAIALLLVAAGLGMGLWRRAERVEELTRPLGASTAIAGLAGSLMALAAGAGTVPGWMVWMSVVCVTWSFAVSYLLWALWFTGGFGRTQVTVLAASFATSIALSGGARLFAWYGPAMAMATPVLAGGCLCVLAPRTGDAADSGGSGGARGEDDVTGACDACGSALRAHLGPVPSYIVLYVAFLLVGAVVRGVTDAQGRSGAFGVRWPVSVVVACALCAACSVLWRRLVPCSERGADRAGSFAFGVWAALAVLFCAGVVWELSSTSNGAGGQLVVVARSTMDFALWLMLCNMGARSRRRERDGTGTAATMGAFMAYGLMTEAVSWALSYALIPTLINAGVIGNPETQNNLMLFSLFALVIVLIVVIAGDHLRRGEKAGSAGADAATRGGVPEAGGTEAGRPCGQGDGTGLASKLEGCGLSPREAEVTALYAHGMSVKRVGAKLGISPGTVQSYLKGAYRKLDVHSRDELVDLCGDPEDAKGGA